MDLVRSESVDVLITDLKMPGMSGLELLRAVKALKPDIEVLLMTAYGTVETAVDAMKDGAYDFVTKPLRRMELVRTIRKALEKRGLILENRRLKEQLATGPASDVIGSSGAMHRVLEEVDQVAPSDANVLLVGESGTGKSMLARTLHDRSRRQQGRLVTVNCAAIPETLLESELFGHEQGAFTGAVSKKEGRFDLARRGTIFLDEVTEMSSSVQVKLLRVLQEGEYERVGGTRTLQADVRVVAASNRDIEEEVRTKRFREDLFYRLNVIQIRVPSLRERIDDVPLLAAHFLQRYATKNRKDVRGLSNEALDALMGHGWPGNVRELENVIERAVVLCRTDIVDVDVLPPSLQRNEGSRKTLTFSVGTTLKTVERRMIRETLRHAQGDKTLAANLLGITSRTIYRREAEWKDDLM